MALPISPVEVLEIVNFAYELVKSCQAAKGEFVQIGKEVNAMRSVMELVQIRLEDPTSIINTLDGKKKSVSKQLAVHMNNCNQSLRDVSALLKKHHKMSLVDRLAWAWSGHDEVEGLMANLSSFATQLDSFVNALALQGIDKLYKTQNNMRMGIGRIEELLEHNGGNEQAAIHEVMQDVLKTSASDSHSQRYKAVITDYAFQAKKEIEDQPAIVERKPHDRKPSSGTLDVPGPPKRAKSADRATGKAMPDIKRSNSAKSTTKKKRHYTLECWLIQIKSGDALFLKWKFSEKELQPRGQWKLEKMAKQFNVSKGSKLDDNHDLIGWVVKDRQKTEDDPTYVWRPHAARIETKGSLSLNMGVEEQAMVIIKRDLTPEAKAKVEAKEKKAQAEQDAANKKAKANAEAKKAKDAELREIEKKWQERRKAEEDKARRKAEIEALRQEVERLKLATKSKKDPTLKTPIDRPKAKSTSPSPKPDASKDRKGSNADAISGGATTNSKKNPTLETPKTKKDQAKVKSPSPSPKPNLSKDREGPNVGPPSDGVKNMNKKSDPS